MVEYWAFRPSLKWRRWPLKMRLQVPGTDWAAGLLGWADHTASGATSVWQPLLFLPQAVRWSRGPPSFSGSEVSGPWTICTFVLDVKLSLLPEASEGRDAGAWANQDARDLGVSRQVEAGSTGQRRNKSFAVCHSNLHDGAQGSPCSHL